MKSFLIFIAVILLAAPLMTHGEEMDDLRRKQQELERLRKEIGRYEEKIVEREKKEHSTLELLDEYDKQANLVRQLISTLHEQEQTLEDSIQETKHSIQELGNQVSFLKRQYAKYVTTLYRYGRSYDLELLLSSRSFNQMLVRSEYLRRFSDQRKKDLDKINTRREAVEEESIRLQRQLAEQRDLIRQKNQEEVRLAAKMKKRKQMLADIRRDKRMLKQEISRRVADAKQLEQLISDLIEQERVRKAAEEAQRRETKSPPPVTAAPGTPFENRRGHLRWPVPQGRIAAHFGNQQHPVLRTVTQNTGIDITVTSGTDVQAVADGIVSTISWLPSFGNLLIIDHFHGYRTVYAHLSEISVSEGQKIGEGVRVGKSGESLTGPMLHFEIWKDREKQNPEFWLVPRGLSQR
jgi:septal ring factor EnvC (AmiA/AmiB activator)